MLTEKEYPLLNFKYNGSIDFGLRVDPDEKRVLRKAGQVPLFIRRSALAKAKLEQREITRAEKRMPEVAQALEQRVKEIFQGVDLAKLGEFRQGIFDIAIKEDGDEKQAFAGINRALVAQMSIWKYPDAESFTDESSRIYTIFGSIEGVPIEFSYGTESKNKQTGEVFEGSLCVRTHDENGSAIIINTPRPILAIAKDFGLIS
jgi:hypothetical protein